MSNRVNHWDVVKRAATKTKMGQKRIRKAVKYYMQELAATINEADPETNIYVSNLGMLRVKKHAAHKGRDLNTGEEVEVPAYRDVTLDPSRRIDNAMKAPLKEFGYDAS